MDVQLGANSFPLFVLLPILLVVAIGVGWTIFTIRIVLWKRLLVAVGGVFALFGFGIFMFAIYFNASHSFADTFRFYAYSALAPRGDPFQMSEGEFQPTLMLRDVAKKEGSLTVLEIANPDYPTMVALFIPGAYIEADLTDNVLTIPETPAGSLPRVTRTSLWWALTKDIHQLVSSASETE